MIEFEVRVKGPFSKQHPLVKFGCGAAFLLFVLFSNYIPLALTVWLILVRENANPPQPDPPLWAWLFVGSLLFGMMALGSYCIGSFVNWFAGGGLSNRLLGTIIGLISLVSVAVAVIGVVLELWDTLLLGAFSGTLISGLVSAPIIGLGQALAKRRQKCVP